MNARPPVADTSERETDRLAKPSLHHRMLHMLRLFLVLFIYLWALLGLFVLNQDIVKRQLGEQLAFQGFAIINALVLAKIMMISEHLDFARWLRTRPAILVISFEALLCTMLFLLFHVVERLVVNLVKGPGSSEGVLSMGGGGLLGVTIVAAILFVSLLPFFAFKNVTRLVGWERMRRFLFQGVARNDRDERPGS